MSVQPQANTVKGFEDYFLGLTVQNNQRNPWFTGWYFDKFFRPWREENVIMGQETEILVRVCV